jgi:signal transduction histidine kinase
VSQFWDAVDRIFALAKQGKEPEARDEIRLSLQARQAALGTAVARLLVENNLAEEQTAGRVQDIYSQVLRQEYWFVGATLTTILLMSLYLIRSNRRLFAELASLSDERREFARQLIETRESTLREISRELHDEFGQILTAMGSMIGRAGRHVPEGSPLQAELHEIREIAQATLDNVRGLSQTLHPSILEEAGLEGTIEWYLPTVERQTGLAVSYERSGPSQEIPNAIAIHVYRVLQEALNNVARHSGANRAWVRLRTSVERLELEVEDHGAGLAPAAAETPGPSHSNGRRRGLGLVAMRERAAIVGGTIEFHSVPDGGTLVRMTVPFSV